jgi:hypothetical protein
LAAYFPHGGWPSAALSKAVKPSGSLLLDDIGVVSINKMASVKTDEQPDQAPDSRVSTDITRCGGSAKVVVDVVGVARRSSTDVKMGDFRGGSAET